jgi:hypothetical protein
LQELQQSDSDRLDSPKLDVSELGTWNGLVRSRDATSLLTEALKNLNAIVRSVEARL